MAAQYWADICHRAILMSICKLDVSEGAKPSWGPLSVASGSMPTQCVVPGRARHPALKIEPPSGNEHRWQKYLPGRAPKGAPGLEDHDMGKDHFRHARRSVSSRRCF